MLKCENDWVHCAAERNGPTVVIAFGGLGCVGKTEAWGLHFFRKWGLSFVSFSPKSEHWYPEASLDVSAATELLDFVSGFDRIATYGFSMGGHAALKFAARFRADLALAMVPQFDIDPAVIIDRRYNKYWRPGLGGHSQLLKPSAAKQYLMADPLLEIDMQHVERIQKYSPAATLIEVHGCEHNPLKPLRMRDMMDTMSDIFEGRFDLAAFNRSYAERIPSSDV